MQTIPILSVIVGTRFRTNLGDLSRLAESLTQHGLIQPIVLDDNNRLVCGGRRLAAAVSLGWTDIPFVTKSTPQGEAQLREYELEENVRRKDMSWTEQALAIANIHALRSRDATLSNEDWMISSTGDLLGMTGANVSYALKLASYIRTGDKDVLACGSAKEALQLLLQRKEDACKIALAKHSIVPAAPSLLDGLTDDEGDGLPDNVPAPTLVSLSSSLIHADCLTWLDSQPPEFIDHIVSDPPYAIDMDNLDQQNQGMDVSRVAAEHDVTANLTLLEAFLPRAFKSLKPTGFCILFCDAMHFAYLHALALIAGFRVQRWPLVWIKQHTCMNNAAQFNFTKRTEFAIVMRKPSATLALHQPANYFHVGNDEKTGDSPFAKPALLWTFIYNAISVPGQSVLDPFAGAGSATIAALRAGLRPIAVESNDVQYANLVASVKAAYQTIVPNVQFV